MFKMVISDVADVASEMYLKFAHVSSHRRSNELKKQKQMHMMQFKTV